MKGCVVTMAASGGTTETLKGGSRIPFYQRREGGEPGGPWSVGWWLQPLPLLYPLLLPLNRTPGRTELHDLMGVQLKPQ